MCPCLKTEILVKPSARSRKILGSEIKMIIYRIASQLARLLVIGS